VEHKNRLPFHPYVSVARCVLLVEHKNRLRFTPVLVWHDVFY